MDPTGDPMLTGVGPGAWTPRRDVPELDGHGHAKIVPMGQTESFRVSAGRDPRGLPVMAGDGDVVGTISDMWVDAPEQLVRYLEIELDADHGGGKRLVPMQFCRIWSKKVQIHAIYGKHFADVPVTKSSTQLTLLEEEKISAYYGGGILYASQDRTDPLL
jgi:photosynthetic reaction center H subunit